MFEIKGKHTTAKIFLDGGVEESCLKQIIYFINHPHFEKPVAIMPDCHAGKGSVIGFTMPLGTNVIPNVIGVDIGCGMRTIKFGAHLPHVCYKDETFLAMLNHQIRKLIPFGFNIRKEDDCSILSYFNSNFPFEATTRKLEGFTQIFNRRYNVDYRAIEYNHAWFKQTCERVGTDTAKVIRSIGTLGGGNHFIELGQSKNNPTDYYLTIHTGSRNFGSRVCKYWQQLATKRKKDKFFGTLEEEIERIKAMYSDKRLWEPAIKKAKHGRSGLKATDFDSLVGKDMYNYLVDMIFTQAFAEFNRFVIGDIILSDVLDSYDDSTINTIHNYIGVDMIIRKGAISAYAGEKVIIPLNMRDGTLICTGKGIKEANYSAPHGAGRTLSRSQARKNLDLETAKKEMAGIYCNLNSNSLDEAPGAYKDTATIIDAIKPLVDIVDWIKPILVLKDNKEGKDK